MNKKEFSKALGLKIKIKRIEKYMSQEELATKANFSLPFTSDVECGKKGISLYYFIKLAKALELDLNNFLEDFTELE
ncbi:MAG: helix-turn-helix transcriptional regulator [Candidatus Gastranaerophilaceae bacterium]